MHFVFSNQECCAEGISMAGRKGGIKTHALLTQEELQRMLRARLQEMNFSDIASFCRASGIAKHISHESVRKALNDSSRAVSPLTAAVIMRFMGYTPNEIRETMRALGDEVYYLLLPSESVSELQPWEAGLLDAARRLVNANEKAVDHLHGLLSVLAGASGVDIDSALAKIKPPRRTRTPKEQPEESGPARKLNPK